MAFQHDDDDDEDIMATSEQLGILGDNYQSGPIGSRDIDEEDEEHEFVARCSRRRRRE